MSVEGAVLNWTEKMKSTVLAVSRQDTQYATVDQIS